MAKKKSNKQSTIDTPRNTAAIKYSFPTIAPKEYLDVNVTLEDQILIIPDLLSPVECKNFVKFVDTQVPLSLTPLPKRGEAERVNYRFSVISEDFAEHLYQILLPHLPTLPHPKWSRGGDGEHKPQGLNKNIRMYKYTPSQFFGPHYDDSIRDSATGTRSEWTLLIYLTGREDGVEGGETIFYHDGKEKEEGIVPSLVRGSALLHRHGNECLLHEGSKVLKGVKYVLRSDLMFLP